MLFRSMRNGNPVRPAWLKAPIERPDGPQRIYVGDAFAGMGELRDDGCIRFRAMLIGEDEQ